MATVGLDTACIPVFDSNVYALASQEDGQIVAGGFFNTVNSVAAPALARINKNGSLDTSFVTPLTDSDFVENLLLQVDGKVVVFGNLPSLGTNIAVARFNSDGSLDTGFVNIAVTNAGAAGYVSCGTVLSDGRLVVGGRFDTVDGTTYRGVAVLNADGTLDTSFTDPVVTPVSGGGGTPGYVAAIVVQADGKLLICGERFSIGGGAATVLARLNADGTVDAGFTSAVTPTSDATGALFAIAVQEDGKIVVGGEDEGAVLSGVDHFAVYRLNADGSIDPGWTLYSPSFANVLDVVIQDDGKVVVAGYIIGIDAYTASVVARLNSDGSVDVGFCEALVFDSQAYGMAMAPDGSILAGGLMTNVNGTTVNYFAKINNDYLPPGYTPIMSMADGMVLSATAGVMPIKALKELASLAGALSGGFEGTAALADTAVLGEALTFTLRVAIEEGLILSDAASADFTAFGRVMARLLVSGAATGYADALVQVLDTLVLAALADAMTKGELSDTAAMSDQIAALYQAFAQILERVVASDALTGTGTAFVLVSEEVALSGALDNTVSLTAALRDGASFAANLTIDNGEYIAWVLNTEGDKPVSRYTQFPFNSFAKVGGQYMACDATGLHWLEGGDDNGEAINARLRAGMSAMGTRRLKRLPEAFIAYRSDGTLLLWIIQSNEETGDLEAGKFLLKARPAQNTRENTFSPGRGWKAVEFDFVLENVDGVDFDLTALEFRPLYLDRRTRG